MLVLSLLACGSQHLGGSTEPTPPPVIASSGDAVAATTSIQQLSHDLYRSLVKEKPRDDLFFSPASIQVALGMTAAGAKGTTADAMHQALHIDRDSHSALGGLGQSWNQLGDNSPFKLSVANRIWTEDGLTLEPEFARITKSLYGAPAGSLSFTSDPEASRSTINQWVEKQTNDKIKNLLPSGSVTTDTRMVLTNAVYFKGDWANPFQEDRTTDATFTPLHGSPGTVRMMAATDRLLHAEGPGYQLAMIPYDGDALDLVVVLPTNVKGLPKVEDHLDPAAWDAAIASASPREVDLQFPKLRVDWAQELTEPLSSLGMGEAFTNRADFSGMTQDADIYIGGVFHKAFLAIDEKGTEAAAATAVVMMTESVAEPEVPVAFHCDRPFMYAIRDRASKALLFVGRQVTVPSAK